MVLAAMLNESVKREARKEAREEHIKRWKEAFDRFGFEVDGVVMLPMTPEVERFLAGEDEPGAE